METKTCTATLTGIAPLQFGKPVTSEKIQGEKPDDYEKRTWRERVHVNAEGWAFIPPMALKNGLEATAKYLAETIPGKGKATYTKHFKAGVMVIEPLVLNVKAKDIEPTRLFVPSDGKKGGGTRVYRLFPIVREGWVTTCSIMVMDPILLSGGDNNDPCYKVREYLKHMATFNGLGSFAPRVGGYYGRYVVSNWNVLG